MTNLHAGDILPSATEHAAEECVVRRGSLTCYTFTKQMSWCSDFWANTAVVVWSTVYTQPWVLKIIP